VALGGVGARSYGVRAGLVAGGLVVVGGLVEVLGACSGMVGAVVAGRVGSVAGVSRSFDGVVGCRHGWTVGICRVW
jgi:hypothetical protein